MNKLFLILLLIPFASSPYAQTVDHNEMFSAFAGDIILMDSAVVARLLNDPDRRPILIDSDGDGKADTKYFINTDERHSDTRQPLLVKVVDEDGDMGADGVTDLDSDIYIADWYADGSIDRIVDYCDLDGDNDVDEQYLYQWTENEHLINRLPKQIPGPAYLVAWAKDYGDDNRLWYHTNYEYGQRVTQWKTDFNGDEMFVYLFFYDHEEGKLVPIWENAFSFYDLDGDTYSEEVVRFSGSGISTNDLRYSMDIDNDSVGKNCHDFDFSLSCIGPATFDVADSRSVTIRGVKTEPIIQWEKMRQVSKAKQWQQIHLTWDENDCNVDPLEGRMHNERWEGVISHGNDYIRQIGGPSCGPYNKRNEVDTDASGGMQFYISPIDRKMHLFGAERGWLEVDYNYDNISDMRIDMLDNDGDGYFDTWMIDANADSSYERTVTVENDEQTVLPFNYEELNAEYVNLLDMAITNNETLLISLKRLLKSRDNSFTENDIERYFKTELAGYGVEFELGKKMLLSRESKRYYFDIIRECYWNQLIKQSLDDAWLKQASNLYDDGKYMELAVFIDKTMKIK